MDGGAVVICRGGKVYKSDMVEFVKKVELYIQNVQIFKIRLNYYF